MPVILLGSVIVMAAVFGILRASSASNEAALQRQTRVARLALSSSADQIAYEQQTVATWEQLPERLAGTQIDRRWLDAEIGRWLSDMFRHDMTFILDARSRPIYAFKAGHAASNDSFEKIEAAVSPLVRAVQLSSPRRESVSVGAGRRSTMLTRETTIFESDALQVDGRPAAVSVMRIESPGDTAGKSKPLMVSVRFLDGTFLKQLSAWHLLHGLRYSVTPDLRNGEHMVQFRDDEGRSIGYFLWEPELPGRLIVRSLGPGTALLVILMLTMMAALSRSIWLSNQRLASTVLDLQGSEAQAQHLAFHDVLTGLANRALFQERLDQALARAWGGENCAVLAIDLDRFKQVNDTLGHAAGDALIQEFARRLSGVVRQADTVARIGGDEFCVLMCSIDDSDSIHFVCERILATVREPFRLVGNEVFVSASIGVAMVSAAGTDRGELLRKADIALHAAKAAGRNDYKFFVSSMDETIKLRSRIEEELRRAVLAGDQLQVHYQPEVDARTGAILGVEALIRWNHPTLGNIPPQQFIPIAEETGLIIELGEWVFAQACRVAARWSNLFVAVNLSAVQFRSRDLMSRLTAIVARAGCNASQIELEITESIVLSEELGAESTIESLRKAGFRVALDDFGTGYSSLSYLRRYKVDKIKIDKSFTHNLGVDGEASAIVTSVITLGHAMGLTVTAEGVENHDQSVLLASAGCNELQGFFFATALPEEDLTQILSGRDPLLSVA
ncbi:putative bifunctional diguanylate cyclase/phosphodiesterase [Novosphingobium gossypii]|uniref:putative bifunctional diguanylate cyclase/phosphodiesterase n=1 Tax=Novosphingobium gossypii TaxID=1604774 RepID=UPI003D1D403A